MSYYELLEVAPTAPVEEIKRAFRQQIARYHPDKVQHLGKEFQEMASVRAAELTQAYRTLSDPALRADYDAKLATGDMAPAAPSAAPSTTAPPPPAPSPPTAQTSTAETSESDSRRAGPSAFTDERAGRDALLRRATIARFRQALEREFGNLNPVAAGGFDIACAPKPSLFSFKPPPRVFARFVPRVDGETVAEAWALAARAPKDTQRDLCVFLLGPAMAAPGELASAIAQQRRRGGASAARTVLVPVNTRDWTAHIPTDAPPLARGILARLRSA